MVQCEMCGAETGAPKTIKVEGAELDVCNNCADLGTEVAKPTSGSSGSKYSTTSSTGRSSSGTTSSSSTTGSSSSRSSSTGDDDMFDSLGELAQDYDTRIRDARESRGLSQEELADQLNMKRSLINKLERGEILPDDGVQSKLERYLEIDLTGGVGETDDWTTDESEQSFTLGEIAERRD